jgi:hypothetical protein
LNGPTTVIDDGEREPLDAYYARWRIAAGSLAARFRRLEPDGSEYMRNIV